MRLVGVGHLKEPTAAHQPPVRHGQDLRGDQVEETEMRYSMEGVRPLRNIAQDKTHGAKNAPFSGPGWTVPLGSRR